MLSVVVLAADVVRIVLLPPEGDPVLLIDADAVLALCGHQPSASRRLPGAAAGHRDAARASSRVNFSMHTSARCRAGLVERPCCRARRTGQRSSESANDWIIAQRYTGTVYP